MKLSQNELARIVRDHQHAPGQPLRDSLILNGFIPEDFTPAELLKLSIAIRDAADEPN